MHDQFLHQGMELSSENVTNLIANTHTHIVIININKKVSKHELAWLYTITHGYLLSSPILLVQKK